MNTLQTLSILMEMAIAILGLLIWFQRKKSIGGLIFLTFFIYMFYDLARLWDMNVPEYYMRIAFAVATISALLAVWKLYRSE